MQMNQSAVDNAAVTSFICDRGVTSQRRDVTMPQCHARYCICMINSYDFIIDKNYEVLFADGCNRF